MTDTPFRFNIKRSCAKCGFQGKWLGSDWSSAMVLRPAATVKFMRERNNEYLLRTCKQCGYSWKEACVDDV